jgi:hypothetical protein
MLKHSYKHSTIVCCIGLLSFLMITLMGKERCHGYIMPAEQLIDLMAKQFIRFKTLTIIQATQQTAYWDDEIGDTYEEQIWFKAPDLFYSKPLGEGYETKKRPDIIFRQFLMANEDTQGLRRLLMEHGVNLNLVALTRIDGTIAYRIGDEAPESPKILIEKERFLPLLLIYQSHNLSTENLITVRFQDYQKLDQGWYPYEITVSYGNEMKETHMIRSIQANEPITISTLYPLKIGTPSDQTEGSHDMDEERLKKIIKQFEEKYQ